MLANPKLRLFTLVCSSALMLSLDAASRSAAAGQCVDFSKDPAGCQPSTFDTPIGDMPSVRDRPDRQPRSEVVGSRRARRRRAAREEPAPVPEHGAPALGRHGSVGERRGDGQLEGRRPRRSRRRPRASASRATASSSGMRTAPASGTRSTSSRFSRTRQSSRRCRSARSRPMSKAIAGNDDRELRSLVYKTSSGQDRYHPRAQRRRQQQRAPGGVPDRHEHVPADRRTASRRTTTSQTHEFFLWHDPANTNRVIAYVTNWTGGVPDAEHPGLKMPDALVMAMTDESTGEMLPKAKFLAGFSLQDVGGPPINEKPDATGLFSDGRFLDFSELEESLRPRRQLSEPGAEPAAFPFGQRRWRAGVRGGNDGGLLYPRTRRESRTTRRGAGRRRRRLQPALDHRRRPTAGPSTPAKLPALANDCLHMVINDDPGLKAFLASDASPQAKAERYLVLMTRSRFDVYPPVNSLPTGDAQRRLRARTGRRRCAATRRTGRRTCGSPTRTAAVRSTTRGCCRSNRRSCRSWSARSRFPTIGSTTASTQANTEPNGQPRRAHRPAESQSDGVQEPRVQRLVRARHPGHRHLQPAHAARGRSRASASRTGSRAPIPCSATG